MRILIVGNLYPPYVFGGYEILCSQVVEELLLRGHSIYILTSDFATETQKHKGESNVERILKLTTDFPRPGESVGLVDFKLSSINRIAKLNYEKCISAISQFKPDLVFCWCLNRLSLGVAFAAQHSGVPVCYTINDEHPKQFHITGKFIGPRAIFRFLAEKWLWPMATFRNLRPFPVTIISEKLKKRLVQEGVPIEHAQVIYQGIRIEDFSFFQLLQSLSEPLKILYTGQLSKAKGVHTILRAAGIFLRKKSGDFRLTIVGSGVEDYVAELKKITEEEGIADKTEFAGMVKHSEIKNFHKNNHIFVFSSEWEEPFGLAHLEAMASGMAVISTTTGGSAELIKDGLNALAYKAGDPIDLADKLERLWNDEANRLELGRNAHNYVKKFHSFQGYVDQLENFLNQALQFEGTPNT
ncbi:MAG: glycosyltransferase family 4 protein [Candidatus Riflebacteria bacterium]|nr:glycosyltransferase family 4 protein [Candidatus Riflebacteria bacterium]